VRVFGIDPGSDRTGYGCVDSDGRAIICGLRLHAGVGATFPNNSIIYRN
jgi:Holliday junction resolvasome RuvABC endonuclease subunit